MSGILNILNQNKGKKVVEGSITFFSFIINIVITRFSLFFREGLAIIKKYLTKKI